MKTIIIAALGLLAMQVSAYGQDGFLDVYSGVRGQDVVSRTSQDGTILITCNNSSHNISQFLVSNGTVTRSFSTSYYTVNPPYTPNPVLNHGFLVKDMEIIGDTCWICGTFWHETGEWVYNNQGYAYWEVQEEGFLGYFLINYALIGSTFIRWVMVPGVKVLNKMVSHPGGFAAVGSYDDAKGRIVELTTDNILHWYYTLSESRCWEEDFRDITYAGGKLVVLSRFKWPQHVMLYKHGIGLRYGVPNSFATTSLRVYRYSSREPYGNSSTDFDPNATLVFGSTHISDGVVVGYVCNPTVPMDTHRGKLAFFVFHTEGDYHPTFLINNDRERYKTVKEMSVLARNKAVVLLEDSLGNSVYRFSLFENNTYEKVLKLGMPKMMSVETFVSSQNDMGLYSGGYFADNQSPTLSFFESNIMTRLNSWSVENCASKTIGGFEEVQCYGQYPADSAMVRILSDSLDVNIFKVYPTMVTPERICTDVK